jgi:ATP-dependent DNA helicase PIF1
MSIFQVPEEGDLNNLDPVVAALFGRLWAAWNKYTASERRANVKKQLRDRFGRWIDMGGGAKFNTKDDTGAVKSTVGTFLGVSHLKDHGRFLVKEQGQPPKVYHIPSSVVQDIEGIIDTEYLQKLGLLGEDGKPDDAKIGSDFVDLKDTLIEDATDEDESDSKVEIPKLPDLAASVKGKKANPTKLKNLLPGAIVRDAETQNYALVTNTETKKGETLAYLRFQSGERRVAKGPSNESVLAWTPKDAAPETEEAPAEKPQVEVTKLQETPVNSEDLRIGDRVFDNGSESYATIESVSRSEDGKSVSLKIKFADGRTEEITRPVDQPIMVWREPDLGSEGKSSEEIARMPEEEKPAAEPAAKTPEPKSEYPMTDEIMRRRAEAQAKADKLPPLPKGANAIDRAIWELERTGKNPSIWNLMWVYPRGVPMEKPLLDTLPILQTLKAQNLDATEEELILPVAISEVTGDALENIKKLKGMGGKTKDMLPEDENVFDAAVKKMLGPEATPAEIAAQKDLIRKKAEDDTREFKVLRVGHNFFVRYREGDDLGPEKLSFYVKQVANMASKISLGETPIFIDLLNEGEIGVGDHILRPGEHGSNVLFGYNYYDPAKDSQGMHVVINTSMLGKTPAANETLYHEVGHGIHYIMTGLKLDPNAPMALNFRRLFQEDIRSFAQKNNGLDIGKAERELFADKVAKLFLGMFEGKTELIDPRFLDFYNNLISRGIADDTYNGLTRTLLGEPLKDPGPGKSGLDSGKPVSDRAIRKVRTADDIPAEVGVGDSVWTTAVSGELENLQIGEITYDDSNLKTDKTKSIAKNITLLIKDDKGTVVKKATVPLDRIYASKENTPTQRLDALTSVDDILAAFDAQNPNFDSEGYGAFNTTVSVFGTDKKSSPEYTKYAGGRLWIRPDRTGATDDEGKPLFEALAWTEKGQSVNGHLNNEVRSSNPREALRKSAEQLAEYNAGVDKAEKIEAVATTEDLTPEDTTIYNPTKPTVVNVSAEPTLPEAEPEKETDDPNAPHQLVQTSDGSQIKFFEDGRINGVGRVSPSLYMPVVDSLGQVIVRSINIKSETSSPFSFLKSDADGNISHVSVSQSTGEISEVVVGNISAMFSDKEKARAAGDALAGAKKATVSVPEEPSTGKMPPRPQAVGIHSDVRSMLSKVTDNDSFRVDRGSRQTDAILNFNGEGQPTNGGFGGFTFQPDPNSNMMVAVVVDPNGNEITRLVVPAGVQPLSSTKKVAKTRLAQGVAKADRGAGLDEMAGDIFTNDDVNPSYSGLQYSSESTDYRKKRFDVTPLEESRSDIDEMISAGWNARADKRRTVQTSNRTYDENNPYERLHPGALVLDALTGRVGRVRGPVYGTDDSTGTPEALEIEFLEGPVSAISGVQVGETDFNEFGQRTSVVGQIHQTATGSDFDDRRFYTIEVRDPEDFTDVTGSFITDSIDGPVLIHDSTVGYVSDTRAVARVAGYSSEGNLIVSTEDENGEYGFREVPTSEFVPLPLGSTEGGSHGSVVGDKYAADQSVAPSDIDITDAVKIVSTLNTMGFLDEGVAKALIKAISGGYMTSSGIKQVLTNAVSHDLIRKSKLRSGRGEVSSKLVRSLGKETSDAIETVLKQEKDPNSGEPPITVSEVVESDTVFKPNNRQIKSVERRLALPGVVSDERAAEIWDQLPLLDSSSIGAVIQELDNAEILHRIDRKMPVDDIFERRLDSIAGFGLVKLDPEVAKKLIDYAPDFDLEGKKLEEPAEKIMPSTDVDEMSGEEMARDIGALDSIKLSNEQEEVLRLIETSNTPIMVTGKAGTGKSTMLKFLKSNSTKNIAVIAPSGMAALNAEGITIPRLIPGDFNIPYRLQDPYEVLYGVPGTEKRGAGKKRIDALENLEMLVIDEISMVNADTIDHIDRILRAAKKQPAIPFGGVQLVMFGDPYQLPPVVREQEVDPNSHASIFREDYQSPWFFHANVWGYQDMNRVQLTEVFRQTDPEFKDLLNAVRNGSITNEQIDRLNEIGMAGNVDDVDQEVVRLYSRRARVLSRNTEMLSNLPGRPIVFDAKIEGADVWGRDDDRTPAPRRLELKVGAKILFLNNEQGRGEDRWVNGDTARITAIGADTVTVQLDRKFARGAAKGGEIPPKEVKKETFAYSQPTTRRSESGRVEITSQRTNNTFTQFPFQLGYAITIHKSQGQTYDEAVIDGSDVFANGQLYVAISRVRSPGGLHLSAPITRKNVMVDPEVNDFMYDLEFNPDGSPITEEQIAQAPAPATTTEKKEEVPTPENVVSVSAMAIDIGDVIEGKTVVDIARAKFGSDDGNEYRVIKFSDGSSKLVSSDQKYNIVAPRSTQNVDEMAGDFTPLPEPYDPLDVDVNPLEVLNIKDPVKDIDGNPITDERHLKYLTDIPGKIRQMEKRLASLEKAGPSLFIGDDEDNAKSISEIKKTLQLSRSNLAQYWL